MKENLIEAPPGLPEPPPGPAEPPSAGPPKRNCIFGFYVFRCIFIVFKDTKQWKARLYLRTQAGRFISNFR